MAEAGGKETPILHVIVVGFHHKKGCQIEYSYPPLLEGSTVESPELPAEWKHLPSLALPDGAHNHDEDTIYFHLPSRLHKKRTVFGVSCYRQIATKDLKIQAADVTRNSVQKSVCVLSHLPLFGKIQAKLELITHAYFEERDFSQVALLEEMFTNLNASLKDSSVDYQEAFIGLCPRELVQLYKHKILVLFKLLLLERKVLFFGSPVKFLTETLLTILSLFPGMIEHGLVESTCFSMSAQVSPSMPTINSENGDFVDVHFKESAAPQTSEEGSLQRPDFKPEIVAFTPIESLYNDLSTDLEDATAPSGDGAEKQQKHEEGICEKTSEGDASQARDSQMEANQSTGHADDRNSAEKHLVDVDSDFEHLKPTHEMLATNRQQETRAENVSDLKHEQPHKDRSVSLQSEETQVSQNSEKEAVTESLHSEAHAVTETQVSDKDDVIKKQNEESQDTGRTSTSKEISLDSDESSDEKQNERKDGDTEAETRPTGTDAAAGEPITRSSSVSDDERHTSRRSLEFYGLRSSDSKGSINSQGSESSSTSNLSARVQLLKQRISSTISDLIDKDTQTAIKDLREIAPAAPSSLTTDDMGLPLAIFTKGSLCHPYLSLQYYDMLQEVSVRSYVIGATNMLFRHQKHLTDCVVEIDEGKLEIHDPELKKQLSLTTADLRFADNLVKIVSDVRGAVYLDNTGWEGGAEWIRGQFRLYLLSLMATLEAQDKEVMEDFGLPFVQAYRLTHNYKVWKSGTHPGISKVSASHPCHGQLSMSDMKLKLSHTMQSTERGKKLNAAVSQTGKAVVQTGKAVGGAINQARSAVSSWFSNLTHEWKQQDTK